MFRSSRERRRTGSVSTAVPLSMQSRSNTYAVGRTQVRVVHPSESCAGIRGPKGLWHDPATDCLV